MSVWWPAVIGLHTQIRAVSTGSSHLLMRTSPACQECWYNQHMDDAVVLERAWSLVNEAMFTIALQHRRLHSIEPEDDIFILRWWADLQLLIVALTRVRRAAGVAARVPKVAAPITAAIQVFDQAIPNLRVMRNVGEHIDDYAVDGPRRRHKEVTHQQLQVGTWDGTVFKWLGKQQLRELNVDHVLTAAENLHSAVRGAVGTYREASGRLR